MAIELTGEFLLGLPSIDDDHRMLVGTINRIGVEIEEASYELCIELFDDFEQAAIAHFSREEELLARLALLSHSSVRIDTLASVGECARCHT